MRSWLVALIVSLLVLAATTAAAKQQCKPLKQAVYSVPDFNSTYLGFNWFQQRLSMAKMYGCRKPRSDGPFNFGVDCECEAWARCGGDDLEYEYQGRKYTSALGECRCCAGWLIALMVVIPFLAIVAFLRRRWIVATVRRLGGCVDERDELKVSTEMRGIGDLDRAELGEARPPPSGRASTLIRRKAKQYAPLHSSNDSGTATNGNTATRSSSMPSTPPMMPLPPPIVSDRDVGLRDADNPAFGEIMTSIDVDAPQQRERERRE